MELVELQMEKVYQHWTLSKRPISARGQVLRHRSVSHTHSEKLSLLSLCYRPFGSCRFCVVVLAPLVRVGVCCSLSPPVLACSAVCALFATVKNEHNSYYPRRLFCISSWESVFGWHSAAAMFTNRGLASAGDGVRGGRGLQQSACALGRCQQLAIVVCCWGGEGSVRCMPGPVQQQRRLVGDHRVREFHRFATRRP